MMKIMIRWSRDKWKYPRRTPGKLISTMTLTTDIDFPDLPKKQHKAMSPGAKHDKRQRRRYLNKPKQLQAPQTDNPPDEYTPQPANKDSHTNDVSYETYTATPPHATAYDTNRKRNPQYTSRSSVG
jgi:hypothetical protein